MRNIRVGIEVLNKLYDFVKRQDSEFETIKKL